MLAEDTLLGEPVEIPADLVVLAVGLKPRTDALDVGDMLGLESDHFFIEADPKMDPVGTRVPGVYLAGCCQGPKDIPDAVAHAKAASSAVIIQLAKRRAARVEAGAAACENIQDSGS